MTTKLIAVYTTVATRADAQVLAKAIIEQRLAACAQLMEIESIYAWQGEVNQEAEWRIIFKTTSERYPDLLKTLQQLHPYQLPQICGTDLPTVSVEYSKWIRDNILPK
ncbi:divalent-cation tolerance protein CutA [Thiospirillum jenense]|uniref:Divalent-cation tolerance protein CutA n=1 Tax=Thiospirillum jenense TaxID=1653858 RepID=A0A839HCN9_9GAMM|nr:divalent-cation tolerance protein CutA [Thiospirillum jenense]MBB1126693.1 divalent-cation tolerance protein CutA [Thiospirillum jenense]